MAETLIAKMLNIKRARKEGEKMSEQQSQLKKVKEIFSDYKTRANILEAKILGLNLLKKKRILELILSSDEYIEIKEIWYLEKYLRERFLFENIELEIKYTEDVKIKNVEKNLK